MTTIPKWPADERPREKLLKTGPATLSDAELLAIFLRTGCAGKTAVDLARDLLTYFGGLRPLLESSKNEFCRARGLGDAKYAQLQAILEMSRRHLAESLTKSTHFPSSKAVKHYLCAKLRHEQSEVFALLLLDSQHRLIRYEALFYGTINSASVYPREVVKCALKHNAAAVVLAHNHPSGNPTPSESDRQITEDLKQALSLIDVEVIDHMVVGDKTVESFAERGWL